MIELRRGAILDSLPAHIAVLDSAGMIVFVNRRWQEFGRSNGLTARDSACGQNYLAVCDAAEGSCGEDADAVAEAIRAALAGRLDHFEREYPCHAPTEQRWFRCQVAPVIGGAVIMHVNVTDKKMAELRTVRAAALMEKLAEQKNRLLANLSHELRTPLNAIIGFSELMMSGALGPLPPRYADYLKDIHSSGVHLVEVVDDLLDLSTIEKGCVAVNQEPVALHAVVAAALTFFVQEAARKNLVLSRAVAEDLIVLADPLRLRQIILNLLSNAVRFTPRGGRVRVEGDRAENGAVRFTVIDTGIGMTSDEIERALTPQGRNYDLKRISAGVGLGLPLTKQLVELQGGALAITSAPGAGSRLQVTLPAPGGPRPNRSSRTGQG